MWPRPALDLGQVCLANAFTHLFLDGLHDFLLGHLAAITAQCAFHLSQVTHFLAKLHIADSYLYIAICY